MVGQPLKTVVEEPSGRILQCPNSTLDGGTYNDDQPVVLLASTVTLRTSSAAAAVAAVNCGEVGL